MAWITTILCGRGRDQIEEGRGERESEERRRDPLPTPSASLSLSPLSPPPLSPLLSPSLPPTSLSPPYPPPSTPLPTLLFPFCPHLSLSTSPALLLPPVSPQTLSISPHLFYPRPVPRRLHPGAQEDPTHHRRLCGAALEVPAVDDGRQDGHHQRDQAVHQQNHRHPAHKPLPEGERET